MDIGSAGSQIVSELYRRSSDFKGGNSSNTLDYINYDIVGGKIVLDIGMTLVSRSYVSSIQSELRYTIDGIKRRLGIPYTVTFELGYCL